MYTVLISAVGVLGTISGAALSAVVAARAEQRRGAAEDAALKRTQKHELQVEHHRWRRERRHSTYLSFLDAMGAADRENQAYFHRLRDTPAGELPDEERLREIRRLFKAAEAAGHAVLLEGPDDVADAAHELIQRLAALTRDVREYALAQGAAHDGLDDLAAACHENGMQYIVEHKTFIGTARAALDQVTEVA
ncbi:hypothetical protein ACXZ65_13935 [Streptomyces aculeolatus]